MSARVIVEQSKRIREAAPAPGTRGGFETPTAAPSPKTEDEPFPIDQDYQLEDGEIWNTGDADIGISYVQPQVYDEVPLPDLVLSPADEILGEFPQELGEGVDPLGTDVGLAGKVSDAEDHGQPFDSEGVVITESFRVPGTSLILNKGDILLMVEKTDPTFKTIKSIKEASVKKDPDELLHELAYGKTRVPILEAEDDDDDDGVVTDDDKKLAYVESQVNFRVPGLGKNQVVILEKGDRFIVRSRFIEEMEPDDTTKGDEAAGAQEAGKPGEVAADLRAAAGAFEASGSGEATDLGIVKEDKDKKPPFPGAAPPFKKKEGEETKKYDKDGKEDPEGKFDKDGKELTEAEDPDKEDEPDPDDPKEGDEPKEENMGGKAKPGFTGLPENMGGHAKPGFTGLEEDKGLTGRRTSRNIKFSLRARPDAKAWN